MEIVFIICIVLIILVVSGESSNKINFGKHKGKKWSEVPENYLLWIIDNHSDKSVRKQATNELLNRKKSIKKAPNNNLSKVYDQDGNVVTEGELYDQLQEAINSYDVDMSSPETMHRDRLKQSYKTTTITPDGIYHNGEYIK